MRRRIEQLEKENACVKTEIKRYQDDKKYLSAENKRVQTENKRLVAEISKLEKERELGVPICRLSALNRGEDVWFGSFGPYY